MLINNKKTLNDKAKIGMLTLGTLSIGGIYNYYNHNIINVSADEINGGRETRLKVNNQQQTQNIQPTKQIDKDKAEQNAINNKVHVVKDKDINIDTNQADFVVANEKANNDYQGQINKLNIASQQANQNQKQYQQALEKYQQDKQFVIKNNQIKQDNYQKQLQKYNTDKKANEQININIDKQNQQLKNNYQKQVNDITVKNKQVDTENANVQSNYDKALKEYQEEYNKYKSQPVLVTNKDKTISVIGKLGAQKGLTYSNGGQSGLHYYDGISLLVNQNNKDNIVWLSNVKWNNNTQLSGQNLIINHEQDNPFNSIKDNTNFESPNLNNYQKAHGKIWYDLTQMCKHSNTLTLTNIATDSNGHAVDMTLTFVPFDVLSNTTLEDKNVLTLIKAPDNSLEFNMNSKKVTTTHIKNITFYYHNDPNRTPLNVGLSSIVSDIDEGQSFDTNLGNQLNYNDSDSNVVVKDNNISLKNKNIYDQQMYSAPQGTIVLIGTGKNFNFDYHQMSTDDAKNIFNNKGQIYDRGTWFNLFGAKTSLNSITKPAKPVLLQHYSMPNKPTPKSHIPFTESIPAEPILQVLPIMPQKPKQLSVHVHNIILHYHQPLQVKASVVNNQEHKPVNKAQIKQPVIQNVKTQESVQPIQVQPTIKNSNVNSTNLTQTNINQTNNSIAVLALTGGTIVLGFGLKLKKKEE